MTTTLFDGGPAVLPVNLNAATEVAVFTTPVMFAGQGRTIRITGSYNVTQGTGGTVVTTRIRQGSGTGGTVLQTRSNVLGAGNSDDIPFDCEDNTGLLASAAGGQYTVTVQPTAATGNGTVNTMDVHVDSD